MIHGPDWKALRAEVLETFTPGPAIMEVADFAGRKAIIQRLQDIAVERARHAIIFGERGVGKTSLANVFYKDLNSLTRNVRDYFINADTLDSVPAYRINVAHPGFPLQSSGQ